MTGLGPMLDPADTDDALNRIGSIPILQTYLLCSLLLILFGYSSLHASPHDWSGASVIYLERGHESIEEKFVFKFYLKKGKVEQIEIRGPDGLGRYIEAPFASLYDFTEKKGIMTSEDGYSIVLDTVSILHSKASELLYLLNTAIEASKDALPHEINVTVVSERGGEKIQINPGDHIRYKRPWKLDAKIQGKEKVNFSLIQTFGEDTEGVTFNGYISSVSESLNIDKNESLENWLVTLRKRPLFNKETQETDYMQIDPAGGYKTIGDILELN